MDKRKLNWLFVPLTAFATLAAIHHQWWAFGLFCVTNTFWLVYNIRHKTYEQAAVYVLYFFINAYGVWKWTH